MKPCNVRNLNNVFSITNFFRLYWLGIYCVTHHIWALIGIIISIFSDITCELRAN